ncbi:hypothetical protein, partial [Staphylococcus chromogenes]|uniref:hypothetical protein n=1 Tax=Staphylococcus chromogenes TaxID=46126 RepID=UPI001A7E0729
AINVFLEIISRNPRNLDKFLCICKADEFHFVFLLYLFNTHIQQTVIAMTIECIFSAAHIIASSRSHLLNVGVEYI